MLYLYFVPFIGFQIKYDDDDEVRELWMSRVANREKKTMQQVQDDVTQKYNDWLTE